jgi:colicin import membrane protein
MLIAKMPKPTKPPVRAKRAKTEVQEEFAEIRREVETARESADPKAQEAARLRADEVRHAVEGTTVESVVQRISGLGLEISKSLADVSGKLVEEVERLSAVREAVELERAELGRLHKIDVAATALDQLVQDYAHEKERLEAEIKAQRATWEEESRNSERERKEQEENLKKARAREIEEYEYKKNLERKKAQDKYEEDQRLQEKKNKERQEALEKSWQQRETTLKEQEQELLRLRKEAQEFPETVKTESEKAAVLAAKAAEQKLEQEILLLKKEAETEKRLASLQVKTLEETLARQAVQIAALQKQVDEAKQQVQDIAVKAIEGASGAKALAHINQIAMEQAKRPQQ